MSPERGTLKASPGEAVENLYILVEGTALTIIRIGVTGDIMFPHNVSYGILEGPHRLSSSTYIYTAGSNEVRWTGLLYYSPLPLLLFYSSLCFSDLERFGETFSYTHAVYVTMPVLYWNLRLKL